MKQILGWFQFNENKEEKEEEKCEDCDCTPCECKTDEALKIEFDALPLEEKMNAGFAAYLAKKKGKGKGKSKDEDDKPSKKDKKEDKKEDKKDGKGKKPFWLSKKKK